MSELSERTRSPWALGVAVFAAAMLTMAWISQFLAGIPQALATITQPAARS